MRECFGYYNVILNWLKYAWNGPHLTHFVSDYHTYNTYSVSELGRFGTPDNENRPKNVFNSPNIFVRKSLQGASHVWESFLCLLPSRLRNVLSELRAMQIMLPVTTPVTVFPSLSVIKEGTARSMYICIADVNIQRIGSIHSLEYIAAYDLVKISLPT